MKIKMIFLAICLASLSILPMSAQIGSTGGGGLGNKLNSSKGGLPGAESSVSITQDQSSITTKFKSDLGTVNVIIKDSKGNTVYFESANTSLHNLLYINTLGFVKGSYSITVAQNSRTISSQVLGIN